MTPDVIAFGDEVVAAGFTVVMPQLFGTPGAAPGMGSFTSSIIQACTSSEFTKLAHEATAPIADWLRSLARELHAELGGPGVGALGMCFTGGYALAMMVDELRRGPWWSPSRLTPFPIGKGRRSADLGLGPMTRRRWWPGRRPAARSSACATRPTRPPALASRRWRSCSARTSSASSSPARGTPPWT